ncbi:galactose oxidase early set domain-containing protein [Streptomyces sp. NPDC001530]|uniref:galactose oxidase early set domain-containing protein n=1 Tax=Streptomyces sp. NPDC001530 TaxID=3364582 RepID=UPI0036B3D438
MPRSCACPGRAAQAAGSRPRIQGAESRSAAGTVAVTSFALVRAGAATYSPDNDQRRLPLRFRATAGTSYLVDMPADPGIALPGTYMLFARDAQRVPSKARMLTTG